MRLINPNTNIFLSVTYNFFLKLYTSMIDGIYKHPPESISEMVYMTNLNILMTHHNCNSFPRSHKAHDKWIEDTKNDFSQ